MTGARTRTVAVVGAIILAALFSIDCSAVGAVAGDTGSCDKRTRSSDPEPICEELVNSVARPQFKADCQSNVHGAYADSECSREKAIGGCEIGGENQDGSHVVDWFYDVTGDANAAKYPSKDVAKTITDVRAFCADSARYPQGGRLVAP